MDVKVRLGLVEDMMGCAVGEESTDYILAEMQGLRKIRDCGAFLWEILCDSETDDGVDA